MSDYLPVPVSAAEKIAEEFKKSIVIINAYDDEHRMLHTTTFGRTPEDKAHAAAGGQIACQALGGLTELATNYEDYRLTQAKTLRSALVKLYALLPKVDNGNCAICKTGYRSYSTDGGLRQKCDNPNCITHEIEKAIKSARKFLGDV